MIQIYWASTGIYVQYVPLLVCDLNSFIKILESQLAQKGPQTRENFATDTGCRKPELQDLAESMYGGYVAGGCDVSKHRHKDFRVTL
jgi:hypothetical protein